MALSTTTVNGTPVPGLLNSITSGQPVGQQATTPTPKAPTNTLKPSQIKTPIMQDLSGTYALVNENGNQTVYNKSTNTGFSNSTDFAKAAGLDPNNIPWSSLKFDTAWKPSVQTPQINTPQPTYQTPSQTPNSGSQTTTFGSSATSSNTQTQTVPGAYSPPNQGTTGVSQGGIIGNLISNGVNQNPNYTAAQTKLTDLAKKRADIAASEAQGEANVESQPIDLSLASGDKGILQRLAAAKQAALQPEYDAAIAELNAANTQTGLTTSALSSAGGLNAPITAGAYMSPSGATTTGQTTSGATTLSALIGQRPSQSNPGVTEFFNTQTGQGFSDPQALADFINKQIPGANVTKNNVFQYLQQNGNTGVMGGGGTLNPLNNIQSTAQAVINNTLSYQDALASGSSIPGFANALQQAISAISPGFNFNVAQGASAAQNAITNTQTQQLAQWKSAQQISQSLTGQLQPLLSKINPSQLTFVNGVIQAAAGYAGNPTYQSAANLLTEIANTYAQVLTPPNGTVTDTVRNTATGMINGLASGQSIAQVIQALDNQAQAKISSAPTATTIGSLTMPTQQANGSWTW